MLTADEIKALCAVSGLDTMEREVTVGNPPEFSWRVSIQGIRTPRIFAVGYAETLPEAYNDAWEAYVDRYRD